MTEKKEKQTHIFRRKWRFLKKLAMRVTQLWSDSRVPTMGAALAYYTCFSLAPLLLLIIAIAGLLFDRSAAEGALLNQFDDFIGRNGALALQALIRSASDVGQGIIAGFIGIGLLLFAATTVLGELRASLNIIWQAPALHHSTLIGFLWEKLLSLSLIAVLGFLLLASLIVSAALSAVQDWLDYVAPSLNVLLQFSNALVFFIVTMALFAITFRFLPNKAIAWRDVWLGSFITALLFSLGKGAIALYIGKSGISNSFGAAGAIVSLLVWVYYSAQILLLGATITRAYADLSKERRRHRI